MPKEEKIGVDAVVSKATALKKAGMPTVLILLVTVMSIPGFWEFFFNRTDEEAKIKAEVSYALLKAQVEAVVEQIKANREEGRELREMVTSMLLQRSGRTTMTDLRLPPAPDPVPVLRPLPKNLDKMAEAAMAAE